MRPVAAIREHPEAAVGLLAAAGLAWWVTVQRMSGMDAGPGAALGSLGWFTGSWVLMMAAMMLPSFAPTLAAYATLSGERGPAPWLLFAGGYLLVWTAVGVTAYGVFELGKDLLGGDLAWHGAGRWVSGGVIALAAAYEFVPIKHACLMRCRGQLGERPRQGWSAALATGARSGGWCIGCSWALMAALFALGVMSLTWMTLIAGLVALEKAGPWPGAARVATAAVLGLLAVGIVVAPHDVPGLVAPGAGGMHAMKMMTG